MHHHDRSAALWTGNRCFQTLWPLKEHGFLKEFTSKARARSLVSENKTPLFMLGHFWPTARQENWFNEVHKYFHHCRACMGNLILIHSLCGTFKIILHNLWYFTLTCKSSTAHGSERLQIKSCIGLLSPHCHKFVNRHISPPVSPRSKEQWSLPIERAFTGLRKHELHKEPNCWRQTWKQAFKYSFNRK